MDQQITARLRLAFGASGIVVSALLVSSFLGILPDDRSLTAHGRAQLCESMAVYSTAMLAKGDTSTMEAALVAVANHNPQIRSVGIRQANGTLLSSSAGHLRHWQLSKGQQSTVDEVRVPLIMDEQTWGTVEVAFVPLSHPGRLGFLRERAIAFPLMLGATTCIFFWLYFGRMLKQLDPNAALPGRVREALDVLAESLILIDQKGTIRFANRVFADLLQVPPQRLVGRSIRALPWSDSAGGAISKKSGNAMPLPWELSQQNGQALVGQMLEITDAQGSQRTLNVSCSPVMAAEGMVRGVMVCCDDVTHLEEIKVELRNARDQADAASAAKSAFVANMSHEIRTPLNAVLGFADVLRRGMALNREEEVEYLDMIHRSGRHLLELINDILDLSKIESGRLQVESVDCSVSEIAHDVVSVLSQRANDKGLQLEVDFASELPEFIQADPTKLRQIITNLTGNAIKFTGQGKITVEVRLLLGKESQIQIGVRDTGIGMTPAQQQVIFNAFEQADGSTTRRFGGTGLGLAISRQFAQAMGGSLTVTSREGEGSTFWLKIPTGSLRRTRMLSINEIHDGLKQLQSRAESSRSLQLAEKDVLVVDDGESNRRLLELILRRAGARVSTGQNGRDALRDISEQNYDLVLMDMQMPVLDGYDATTMIRSTGCKVPIIALTGNAMKGDRERCLQVGCDEFLTKPVNVDLLVQTVGSFLGFVEPVPSTDREAQFKDWEDNAERQLQEDVSHLQQELRHSLSPVQEDSTAGGPIRSTLPMNDAEFREIVVDFVPRLHDKLRQMLAAQEREDFLELAQLAHWLKGSAGTMGFHPLVHPADNLQRAAQAKATTDCREWLGHVEQLIQRIESPTALATLGS